MHSKSIPGTNTEQGFSDSYEIKIQLITETTEREGEFQKITEYRNEDKKFTEFIRDNEEDDVWDNE
ncbi:MAG: hypothetical protein ACTSPP_09460 [Candidatus Heimdallarchaeaceae archaeon]